MTEMAFPHQNIALLEQSRQELKRRIEKLDKAGCFHDERALYRLEIVRLSYLHAKEVALMQLDEAFAELGRQIQQVGAENLALRHQVEAQTGIVAAAQVFHEEVQRCLRKLKIPGPGSKAGEKHRGTRYTEEDVQRWIAKRRGGMLLVDISKEEGVRQKTLRTRLRQRGVIAPTGLDKLTEEEGQNG